jgi:hypothetical protein
MGELSDLEADPYERDNLAGEPELEKAMEEMRAELANLLDPKN